MVRLYYTPMINAAESTEEREEQRLGAHYDTRLPQLTRWQDRKSTRLNSSHIQKSRMPSSA